MSGNDFAKDYVDVAERIGIFRDKYPDGSLAVANPDEPYRLLEVGGVTYIVVVACAYRSPNDAKPGVGMAQEQIPGRTPYTKGSELQNAETSAWGRAIVAALAADTKKGVASAEEVRNRRAEQETPAETDLAWMEDFDSRITLADSVDQVRGLWQEAVSMHAQGRLTVEDHELLKKALTVRSDELKPS